MIDINVKINEKAMENALKEVGIMLQEKAVRLVPVDMGQLMASIYYKVDGDTLTLGSNCPYAVDMEFGKPPGPLSEQEKQAIREWSFRHNFDERGAEMVVKKIQYHGIRIGEGEKTIETPTNNPEATNAVLNPHITPQGRFRPFLRPTIHQNTPKIKEIIKAELK